MSQGSYSSSSKELIWHHSFEDLKNHVSDRPSLNSRKHQPNCIYVQILEQLAWKFRIQGKLAKIVCLASMKREI